MKLLLALCLLFPLFGRISAARAETAEKPSARLLYQGHGSLRIVTAEGKVLYVDPYAGGGYDLPADCILVSHSHRDHSDLGRIAARSADCRVITNADALVDGEYRTFDLGYAVVEAVQAGNNRNHDIRVCVGWLITLPDGVCIYATGDTSTTEQMAALAERKIDYAFFVCDGVYNMDLPEAIECARLVGARHSIPYHMAPGKNFDPERAERFDVPGRLILRDGEEILLD